MYIKDLKKISSISRICFETPCKSRTYLNQHVSSKCFICYSLNYQGYIKFLLKSASFLIAVFSILELENRQIEENGKVFSQIPTFLWFHQYYEANSIEFKILNFKWRIFPYFVHHCFLKQMVLVDFRYLFRASPTYFWQQIMMFYILSAFNSRSSSCHSILFQPWHACVSLATVVPQLTFLLGPPHYQEVAMSTPHTRISYHLEWNLRTWVSSCVCVDPIMHTLKTFEN